MPRSSREQRNGMSTPTRRHPVRESSLAGGGTLRERALSALVYAGLFVCLITPYTDYDWGWHYRYGEYLVTHGQILRHDIYSWTMPGYEWVNHSWLYDPLLYFLYNRISFFGLALAGAAAGLLTFYLCIRQVPLVFWHKAVLAMFFAALSKEALLQGLRTQVVGLLVLALFIDLLYRERQGHRWAYWALPGLFCLWTNLHGSFLLGLIVFGVHAMSDLVLLKIRGTAIPRRWLMFAASFFASVALSLLNPFTYRVYLEAWRHFGNPMLPSIIEWSPPDFSEIVGVLFLGYTLVLAVGFIKRRTLSDLPTLVVAALTFYLAVSSRRHVPVFLVLTLPFVALIITNIRLRVAGLARTSLVLAAMIAVFGTTVFVKRAPFEALWRNPTQAYCSYGMNCSPGLVRFLIKNPPIGRGFNFYDWGGYLIGNGVQTKLFIDGRMHLWERGDFRPMERYMAMYQRLDLDAFERYQFDWLIVPRGSTFAKAFAAHRSPWTGARTDDVWEVPYVDDAALYAVRKKGRSGA
jgi:hypothetical protein